MKMRSLSSLSISRIRNLHLISAALAVTAAAVDDRVEPSCALPSVSASLSLRAGAEVGPGRRGEAAGSEAANGGEDTDNDRPLKRRRREERQRERGDALQENLSSRKRERELKWRRRHPVSQSFNPASK